MPGSVRSKKLQKILNAILGTPGNMVKVRLTKDQERIRRILNTQANRMSK